MGLMSGWSTSGALFQCLLACFPIERGRSPVMNCGSSLAVIRQCLGATLGRPLTERGIPLHRLGHNMAQTPRKLPPMACHYPPMASQYRATRNSVHDRATDVARVSHCALKSAMACSLFLQPIGAPRERSSIIRIIWPGPSPSPSPEGWSALRFGCRCVSSGSPFSFGFLSDWASGQLVLDALADGTGTA
jgi:hypothetical protein